MRIDVEHPGCSARQCPIARTAERSHDAVPSPRVDRLPARAQSGLRPGPMSRAGLVGTAVLALHGVGVWALLQQRIALVDTPVALRVFVIDPPDRGPPPAPTHPAPQPLIKARLEFEAPSPPNLTEAEIPAEIEILSEAPAIAEPAPATPSGPMALADELSVFCPTRTPPAYPLESKHLHEQGEVTLRVELDEDGRVRDAVIVKSSGHAELDEAGRTAVLKWRCHAAMHDGKPARAVAMQSLEFALERR